MFEFNYQQVDFKGVLFQQSQLLNLVTSKKNYQQKVKTISGKNYPINCYQNHRNFIIKIFIEIYVTYST